VDLLAKFDAYAESSRLRFGVPGMAIAVIQGKSMVFSKGYGARVQGEPATVDTATVFQIGSISKSFTATVMGTLVDEGKAAFVTFVFGEAGQALELRFIRGFDDADDGRFTRSADR